MMLLGLMTAAAQRALHRKPVDAGAPRPLGPLPEPVKQLARSRVGMGKASVWPLRGVDGRPFHERKPR